MELKFVNTYDGKINYFFNNSSILVPILSGLVNELNLSITLPFWSIKNFSKFHLILVNPKTPLFCDFKYL